MGIEKISKLKAIQAEAQVFAEAISGIIELDTVIVDNNLVVVAGTGLFKKRVGTKEEDGNLQAGFLYGRVITNGKPEIVEDADCSPEQKKINEYNIILQRTTNKIYFTRWHGRLENADSCRTWRRASRVQ